MDKQENSNLVAFYAYSSIQKVQVSVTPAKDVSFLTVKT